MNFYISDLNIVHPGVIEFDNRPFADLNEMQKTIIDNWNSRVQKNDTVYIVGDFIWYKEKEWSFYLEQLCGNKVLVRGNHDPKRFSETTQKFFQDITNFKEVKDTGRHIILCHYPIPFFRTGFLENSYMLYGHVHMTKEYEYLKEMRKVIKGDAGSYGTPTGNFINIGAILPYMDYSPRTLDEIIAGDEAYRKTNDYLNKAF